MSKRALVKYLQSLDKQDLENQVLELYDKFKPVKTYYNFVFNPKENKLIGDAKAKISKEYFPVNGRKPKARRSVAQKLIRHFLELGVDQTQLADLMVFNIETALRFNEDKKVKQEAFYKSIYNSFDQTVDFVKVNGLKAVFWKRLDGILNEVESEHWFNAAAFENKMGELLKN